MLKNRKYIGEYRYQDVVIPGGVPAIVPEHLFETVQYRLEKNKRAPAMAKADEDFLLTTKLFCGKCERLMVGESGTSRTGAKHYYYKCVGAKRKKDCDKKSVKKDWIERVVVILTIDRVLQDQEINRIADSIIAMQEREDGTIPALHKQLAETEKRIENMLNAIQMGVLTSSTKSRLESLEKQRDELNLSILSAQIQKPILTKQQILDWIGQFRYGDINSLDYRKRVIESFVNAVYVYEDKLVLTYNFKGGTQTISLADIEEVYGSDFDKLSPPFIFSSREKLRESAFWLSLTCQKALFFVFVRISIEVYFTRLG